MKESDMKWMSISLLWQSMIWYDRGIDLEGNEIGNEGVMMLFKSITNNKKLCHINVSNDMISEDEKVCDMICDALQQNTSMREINLDGNVFVANVRHIIS